MQKSQDAIARRKAKADKKADEEARDELKKKIQEYETRLAAYRPTSKKPEVQKLKADIALFTVRQS